MRTIALFISLTLIFFISCQSVVAQPNPAISKKYSNTEIEKMISAHKSVHSQDTYPATSLLQQLRNDFPKAKDMDWEVGANIYEAEFEIGWTDYTAYYDEGANLLMYTVELRETELPAIVKNAAMSKYPNYKFDDIKKIVKGTDIFYKVEMEKRNSMDIKATFRPDGAFLKEITN